MYPHINPVAFRLGPVAIHWYGIAYMVGLVLGLWYAKWLARRFPARGITADTYENLFLYIVLGVILGGRLGYVLFYGPLFYLAHPAQILMVWEGGMSFHGGLLGVTLAMALFAYRHKVNVVDLADRVAPAVPIGLFLGRLANFINGELVGRPTSPHLPWAMVFPQVDALPRHPSQLYEAGLEGLVLFLVLYLTVRKGISRWLPVGVFVTGYALARIFVENFRTPEITHTWAGVMLTQGQLLSLPMLAVGLFLMVLGCRNDHAARNSS